jgi:hypothetical protein
MTTKWLSDGMTDDAMRASARLAVEGHLKSQQQIKEERDRWMADAIRYRTALLEISNHWANEYDHPKKESEMYRGSYGIGITDGHRACKIIADRALSSGQGT